MRYLTIAATALGAASAATPAAAQYANSSGVVLETPASNPRFASAHEIVTGAVTPTMRRQKLRAAAALRAEVRDMLAAAGGQLSERQVAYVRQRVRRIDGDRH